MFVFVAKSRWRATPSGRGHIARGSGPEEARYARTIAYFVETVLRSEVIGCYVDWVNRNIF